jgi:hypothetical protein
MNRPQRKDGIIVNHGNIHAHQVVAGQGAQAIYSGDFAAPGAEELKALLRELHAALGSASIPEDTRIAATTAVGRALSEGARGVRVDGASLEQHMRQLGTTLQDADVAVERGSALWASLEKLSSLLGPIVMGGAPAVAAWFRLSG